MKKFTCLVVALLLALTLCHGETLPQGEAADITALCKYSSNCKRYKLPEEAFDRRYTTSWDIDGILSPTITFTAPEQGEKIYALYLCFGSLPEKYDIQTQQGENWVTVMPGDTRFHHATYRFPEGLTSVRIYIPTEEKIRLFINELFIFGKGELPSFVQQWQPTVEKADIMFLATHPDDDLIFFGGAIPTYAVEKQAKTAVAYFTHSGNVRRSELLNALWSMGIRNYPILGEFHDHWPGANEDVYKTSGGKDNIYSWLTEILRKYKPEVLVTQDKNGEYGHPQHRMLSKSAFEAVDIAADNAQYPDSAEKYGSWQVKKLYRHLWQENQIVFDWNVPLESAGGKTSLQLAEEAFSYHRTQQAGRWNVAESGKKYKNNIFGLAKSTVGEDVAKNDFLENIP